MNVVIDTNVLVAASGRTNLDTACQLNCVRALEKAHLRGRVFVDELGLIFGEYARYLYHSGRPTAGDAFFRHIFQNQANRKVCQKVRITRKAGLKEDYDEFPNDRRLSSFDSSDRKFVAVALASVHRPRIQRASDERAWGQFESALRNHNVKIDHLCQETGCV